MTVGDRNLYAQVGVNAIPKILGQLDRNRLSPTYGCFDKAFWHYRTASFPTGMSQEFVLPLALVYRYRFPAGDAYFQQPNLKAWAEAGIHYASLSAHSDGSCDDYFPYERALGAVAFSLYACTESALLLNLHEAAFEAFFVKRGRWLIERQEAGRLSNHHALTALALFNVYLLTDQKVFQSGAQQWLNRLLSWQSAEGWFPEYEGCDPGYHTATIDFLAKYYRKSRDAMAVEPLRRAVQFADDFLHPDGSCGGTYGSRNTTLFFPHGFELLGPCLPSATSIADRYLRGIERGTRVFLEDDRLIGHLTYNHLQAYLDYCPQRSTFMSPKDDTRVWREAGLFVRRQGRLYAVISLAKGGAVKLFEADRLQYADSGIIARQHDGRCLVTHLIDRYDYQVTDLEICISGSFGYRVHRVFTPLTMLGFHLMMVTLGRYASNLIRALLQRLLIVGKAPSALRFRRTFQFHQPVILTDEIWDERRQRLGKHRLTDLYAGTDHTSVYVAMSHAYQSTSLQPWTNYADSLSELHERGYVKISRSLNTVDVNTTAQAKQNET